MKPEDLVRALKTVPAKRLELVELAHQVCNSKGELDLDRVAERMDAIHVAIQEARAYAEATGRVLWQLDRLVH